MSEHSIQRRGAHASTPTVLIYAIIIFQIVSFLLLALQQQPLDTQALALAIIFPIGTLVLCIMLPRVWDFDIVLLLLMLFLLSVGMVTLQDITQAETARKQALFIIPSLIVMLVSIVVIRRMQNWERWSRIAGVLALLLMFTPMLPVIGGWNNGARAWVTFSKLGLNIGFQPSEFVKIILLLVLSSSFSAKRGIVRMIPAIAYSVVLCGILLALQRDLGTLVIYFFLTIGLFYISTSNLLLTGIGMGCACIGSVGAYYMFDHVRVRVSMWQNPWSDPSNKGYQIIQALIAIGSGGMFGRGLGLAAPRSIPYYHTDFIFAAVCEEFGTLFSVCIIIVYGLIVWRGVRIALSARTAFHSLMAFGATLMLAVQTLLIIGGVIKMIPLTGVTLPFMSAGGSSLISCFCQIGILLGISSMNADADKEDAMRALEGL